MTAAENATPRNTPENESGMALVPLAIIVLGMIVWNLVIGGQRETARTELAAARDSLYWMEPRRVNYYFIGDGTTYRLDRVTEQQGGVLRDLFAFDPPVLTNYQPDTTR